MTVQWIGMPKEDRWAGTPLEIKPLPDDETLIKAIQKERGDLRRVAWELGNLDQERLYYHVTGSKVLRPIYLVAAGIVRE